MFCCERREQGEFITRIQINDGTTQQSALKITKLLIRAIKNNPLSRYAYA
jgi:hypothetical protein